jgi:two-component system, sensor histidine kinase and response regulator
MSDNNGTILIVDDTPANLDLLGAMLADEGYDVRPAINGQVALMAVRASLPDLILLDINMPGKNGYEVCQELKADEQTAEVPIIFLSALDEIADKVRAFQVGGVDYITKPFQFEEVLARVENQLTLYRQRREIEELREKERRYFEELNKMKDQFVNTVSHDLKNPINNIMGYAEMLLEDEDPIDDLDEIRDIVARILYSSQQMYALVTDLLDLAKIEAGMALTLNPVPLNKFLDEHVKDFELLARHKQIKLIYSPPETEIIVTIDSSRLGQVLSNLLSNAIKYTPEAGEVEIVTEIDGDYILIRIVDTGLGIPTEDVPHLFDKFYRVRREEHLTSEGTGLGLSIAKAIVEKHSGKIWAESELGAGSVFNIALPVA